MKYSVEDLVLFGGEPAFSQPLHVGQPNVGNRQRFLARVNDLLERRWLTNDGPYVQALEAQVATLHGVRHCVATCNGTAALELAIRALELRGEVIVPALTFVATAHALHWHGLRPVFCDVDPQTHNIDPAQVEALITRETSAILGVHLWGRACDVSSLATIARRHNLHLLYDGAHAFACSALGRPIGQFGDATVLSFHATKVFNTFEGGAVLTDDDHLAQRLRQMRNFGFAGLDQVVSLGINAKMNEVEAAMGLTLLEELEETIGVNRAHYQRYRARLAPLPAITMVAQGDGEQSNFHYIVLEVDEKLAGLCRDELVALFWAENVRARRYFYPGCHRMEPYCSLAPDAPARLPCTEHLTSRLLALPTGTAVTAVEVDAICHLIQFALDHSAQISGRTPTVVEPNAHPSHAYTPPHDRPSPAAEPSSSVASSSQRLQ